VQKYYLDPTLEDFTDLSTVTTGTETSMVYQEILQFRSDGYTTSGTNIFRDVKISEPKKNGDGVVTSTVTYCSDPAQLETKDADGNPVELDTTSAKVTLEQLPDKSWRAANFSNEVKKC